MIKLIESILKESYLSNQEKASVVNNPNAMFDKLKDLTTLSDDQLRDISTRILKDITRGKPCKFPRPHAHFINGLPGSGKSTYIQNIATKSAFVPFKGDMFEYFPNLYQLQRLLPVKLTEDKEYKSFYSINSESDNTNTSNLGRSIMAVNNYIANVLIENNAHFTLESTPIHSLETLKRFQDKGCDVSTTVLIIPERLRKINALHRYEEGLSRFLEARQGLRPKSSDNIPHVAIKIDLEDKFYKGLNALPQNLQQMNIPFRLLNPITNKDVKDIGNELNRPLNDEELQILGQKKIAIYNLQKQREADPYSQKVAERLIFEGNIR
jgi:hypothetical protein